MFCQNLKHLQAWIVAILKRSLWIQVVVWNGKLFDLPFSIITKFSLWTSLDSMHLQCHIHILEILLALLAF